MNSFRMTDLAEEERPREKLMTKGVVALTNAELLAILMGTGSRNENAVELARRILMEFNNNLDDLGKASLPQLKKYKGVGKVKAISIIAAMELGRRRSTVEITEKKKVTSSQDVFLMFQPMMNDLTNEELWVVFLNNACRMIDKQKMSNGGSTIAIIEVKDILKKAIDYSASQIILCHNHPSGTPTPSKYDIAATLKVEEAAKLFDIKLNDHIIIAKDKYYSFADEGMIINE